MANNLSSGFTNSAAASALNAQRFSIWPVDASGALNGGPACFVYTGRMAGSQVARIEVRQRDGAADPLGAAVVRAAQSAGLCLKGAVRSTAVYLLESEADIGTLKLVASSLLADPVTQEAVVTSAPGAAVVTSAPGASVAPCTHEVPVADAAATSGGSTVEIHPLPGVTDPAAQSVERAVQALFGFRARVVTGRRYDFDSEPQSVSTALAERLLANTVIQSVHSGTFHPSSLPAGHDHEMSMGSVPLRDLSDPDLELLSRKGHLFLSLPEMQAVQAEYRRQGREPTEIELETIAQTWSEHCVHKTLKSTINYREIGEGSWSLPSASRKSVRPGHAVGASGEVTIKNLLKSTIAAATKELTDPTREGHIDWCLSVFVDNSGVVAFDDTNAVCFKVETHNRPSAIEPYGGAATGIGGCIRDVMGTGLGAKPIACTDVFCVAPPDMQRIPQGCLPPRRILSQVVAGVRDYGNRMGIPTVNGGVWFDERHVGNPLVFCGTVGVLPRDKVHGRVHAGDTIVAIGGRTGRDGIHGATFSSAEVAHAHAAEFSHAVQIGNAITEKQALDLLMAARDSASGCLYSGLTDCGAGGFSSAIGEMARECGAVVHLDRAPVKYAGLTPTEVWISEAQERMTLAVPQRNLAELMRLCDQYQVEMCELGTFGSPDRSIHLMWKGLEVGCLSTEFLHEGVPMAVREAIWDPAHAAGREAAATAAATAAAKATAARSAAAVVSAQSQAHQSNTASPAQPQGGDEMLGTLCWLLAHPNISSKQWIVRQYDHEVQGGSVVKPFVGVGTGGPSDAAVVRPVPSSSAALAIANGLATGLAADPYWMTLGAIDECVRNLVCVGARADRIAILDNFSWPDCDDPRNLGSLVRAAEACYDGALAYRAPFISGKDSLRNQFRTEDGRLIQIPPTLLISGFSKVDSDEKCVTMDAKRVGSALVVVGCTDCRMGGSHRNLAPRFDYDDFDSALPETDLVEGPRNATAVAAAISAGLVLSAHDCSEGGLLLAAAEMAFAGDLGLSLDLSTAPLTRRCAADIAKRGTGAALRKRTHETLAFAETPSRYLLEVDQENLKQLLRQLRESDVAVGLLGTFDSSGTLSLQCAGIALGSAQISALRAAWQSGSEGW